MVMTEGKADLIPHEAGNVPAGPSRSALLEMGHVIAREGAYSQRTIRQYLTNVKEYEERGGRFPCSKDDLIAYVTGLIGMTDDVTGQPIRHDTIRQHIDAIRWEHRRRGMDDPMSETVRQIMTARRRAHPDPVRRAKPIRPDLLRRLIALDDEYSAQEIRTAAMIAMGWGCAMRAGEIGAVRLDDLEWTPDGGLVVTIRKSKSDQAGHGQFTYMPADDPLGLLAVVRRWVKSLPYAAGFLFPRVNPPHFRVEFPDQVGTTMMRGLTRAGIWLILRARLEAIGEPVAGYSPHSMRAGFATSCAEAGAKLVDIQRQTRHKSLTTLMVYIRDSDAMQNHAMTVFKTGGSDNGKARDA